MWAPQVPSPTGSEIQSDCVPSLLSGLPAASPYRVSLCCQGWLGIAYLKHSSYSSLPASLGYPRPHPAALFLLRPQLSTFLAFSLAIVSLSLSVAPASFTATSSQGLSSLLVSLCPGSRKPSAPSTPVLSDYSPSVPGSGPTAGWLWSSLWVGEPQIAATWNKHFQHMLSLAACHHSPLPANITLQLKEGKLPDQCFSYSPVSRLHGESRSSPCQELEF